MKLPAGPPDPGPARHAGRAGNLQSPAAPILAKLPLPDGRTSPHRALEYPVLATNC